MYNNTLDRFMNDKSVQNIPEVYASVEDTYHYWKEHEAYMQSLLKLSNSINDSLAYINKNNTKLLNTMDSAVWLYTQYSEEKNDIFIRIQYLSLIIALIIIL